MIKRLCIAAAVTAGFFAVAGSIYPVYAEEERPVLVSGVIGMDIFDDEEDDMERWYIQYGIRNLTGHDIVFAAKSENGNDLLLNSANFIYESDADLMSSNENGNYVSTIIPATYTDEHPFYLYVLYEDAVFDDNYNDIEYGLKLDTSDYDGTLVDDPAAFDRYFDTFDYRNQASVQPDDMLVFSYDGTKTGRETGLENYRTSVGDDGVDLFSEPMVVSCFRSFDDEEEMEFLFKAYNNAEEDGYILIHAPGVTSVTKVEFDPENTWLSEDFETVVMRVPAGKIAFNDRNYHIAFEADNEASMSFTVATALGEVPEEIQKMIDKDYTDVLDQMDFKITQIDDMDRFFGACRIVNPKEGTESEYTLEGLYKHIRARVGNEHYDTFKSLEQSEDGIGGASLVLLGGIAILRSIQKKAA